MPVCDMPGCFRGKDKDQIGDKLSEPVLPPAEWREPPGYLGEAVRRAKRISGRVSLSPVTSAILKEH